MKGSVRTTARAASPTTGDVRPRIDVCLVLALAVVALALVAHPAAAGSATSGPPVAAGTGTQSGSIVAAGTGTQSGPIAADETDRLPELPAAAGNGTQSGTVENDTRSGEAARDAPVAQSGPDLTGENVTRIYGTDGPVTHNQGVPDVVRTPDGGLIAIRADVNETSTSTVVRLDADGNVLGEETVPGILQDVERVGVGSYAAAGVRGDDALVVWIDAGGSVDWTRTYGGEAREVATDVASAPDGDAYLLASTESFGVGTSDLWAVRINASSGIVWDRVVEHEKWTAFPEGVRLADGSLIATIRTERSMNKSVDGQQNVSVSRIAPDGSVSWRTVVAGEARPNDKEEMFDVIPAHGEGVLMVGASNSGNDDGTFDFWAARVDADGGVLWQRRYETPTRAFVSAAVRTADGYALAGFAERQYAPGVMGKLLAIGPDGSERFATTFAQIPHYDNRFLGMDWTTRGQLALSGTTVNRGENVTRSGAWIVGLRDAVPDLDPAPSVWATQHPNAPTEVPAGADEGSGGDAGGSDDDAGGSDADGQGGDADGQGGDAGEGNDGGAMAGDADEATATGTVTAPESSADLVLYGATALSAVALFVPYGLRRFRRN